MHTHTHHTRKAFIYASPPSPITSITTITTITSHRHHYHYHHRCCVGVTTEQERERLNEKMREERIHIYIHIHAHSTHTRGNVAAAVVYQQQQRWLRTRDAGTADRIYVHIHRDAVDEKRERDARMRARSLPHLRRCPAFSQRTRTALVTLSHLFTWTGHDYLSLSQLQGIMSYACGRVHYSIVREDDTAAARQRARKTELLRTRARAPTQWPRIGARIPMRVYEQAVRVPPFPPLPPARILGIVDREEASA